MLLLALLCLRSAAQTGIPVSELAHCDASMQQFLDRWRVLGASVAIAKDGRLVYERGFGYADLERTVPMQPYHLLRVASISKPVTALAIMKLVEEGELGLAHKVFGPTGYLRSAAYTREIQDPRLYEVTVQQLLEHSGGWDRSSSCDDYDNSDPINFPTHVAEVMHVPNPVGDSTIIRFMLRKGLNFAPGTQFAYSNVGYLVLGKVLEAVTHQPYEVWVRQHVLVPSGVVEAHLGHNLPTARQERESDYLSRYRMLSCYGPGRQVPAAYGGFQVEAMNAHGGWLFSARDLVRLALAADGFASPPDLISAATLRSMTQPSAVAPGYAKGWMVSGGTWWHTGQLDGTASIVMRTPGGYTWAILLNTSNGSARFWDELKALGWTWVSGATAWPSHDLFAPVQNATRIQLIGPEAAHLAWTNGSGTRRLLLLKADSPSTAFPLDGMAYPTASRLPDGTLIAANGPDSTAELSHRNPNRTYYARVVEYRQDATTGNQPVYALDGNPVQKLSAPAQGGQAPPLALYPNPAQNEVRVDGTTDNLPYQLTNAKGETLQKGNLTSERTIPVRHLASGTYFLRVRQAWRETVLRLVKL